MESEGSILLVDDERLNRDMLSRRLSRSGYSVAMAGSGREAIEMVGVQSFDLVLLDQMMPEISGMEVLRVLRTNHSPETLPIVMVTAVAESDKIAEALEGGANDYITKPIDFKVALARIRSQLFRKRAEDDLRQSEERYALAARASRHGLWDWNLTTGEVYFSTRWKEMLGIDDRQAANTPQTWFSRILLRDREAFQAALRLHLDGQTELLQCSYRMLNAEGAVRWMSCHGVLTRDQSGDAVRLAGSLTDVTEEKTLDALTGMFNRLRLLGDLEVVLGRARVPEEATGSHAVLLLRLDGLQQINDSLGHEAVDQLFKDIAVRLEDIAHPCGGERSARTLAVRMGGGEFAILLKEDATPALAQEFALRVQCAINPPFALPDQTVRCSFSIGIAPLSDRHTVPEDVLHDAGIALSTAQRRGRGESALFTPDMHDAAVEKLTLTNDIHHAVERGELEVAYQPKVNLVTGLAYGVEGLLRWNHPVLGLLQPASFIAIAEETGAIVEFGKWILSHACSQVRAWHDQIPMEPPLELSINLSPSEFKQEDLIGSIRDILSATGFPPACLHLEITEDVLFGDIGAARATLHALKELGVSLDMDDFGSGYSSLKYLQELPFDLLKVDRYFIQMLDPERPASGGLIKSIISMAHDLGMKVVAEGIDSVAHKVNLEKLGCRLGQGHLFSKPIDAAAMQSFLFSERPAGPAAAAANAITADTSC